MTIYRILMTTLERVSLILTILLTSSTSGSIRVFKNAAKIMNLKDILAAVQFYCNLDDVFKVKK